MSVADLPAKWRGEADALERTATAYKRTCVKDKAVQNILLARQLRRCAEDLERELGSAG